MIDVDLAFPLSAGLVAAFNPCGFAMLPAYLSYFLGLEGAAEADARAGVTRGLAVGLTLSAGFVFLFGLVGVLTGSVLPDGFLERRIGYATLTSGVLMVIVGLALVRGFEIKLRVPGGGRGPKGRGLPSVFAFGVSYAVVSISCTAPIFFGAVLGSFSRVGFVNGLAVFIAYAVGMSLVIVTLTIALATARTAVAANMRRFLPYVTRLSGGLLIVAGLFLAWYGTWEIRIQRDPTVGSNQLVDLSNSASARLSQWVVDVGGLRFAMAALMIVSAALTWALSGQLADRGDQRVVRGGFLLVYLSIEGLWYDFDLLLLGTARTVAETPVRIRHWFTDPLRWPVVFELLAVVLVLGIAAGVASRVRAGRRLSVS